MSHSLSLGGSNYHRQFEALPLLTRGWVYQERLLSPRVLHFASHKLMWECIEEPWCEYMEIHDTVRVEHVYRYWYNPKVSHATAFRRDPKLYVEFQWRKKAGDYSRLNLTFKKDKLPAISGAARDMQPMRGRYLAGLWEDTFFDDIIRGESNNLTLTHRPQEWRGPTWSWVSIDSPVDYDHWNWDHESNFDENAYSDIETHVKLL
jgi:hypothetical protein